MPGAERELQLDERSNPSRGSARGPPDTTKPTSEVPDGDPEGQILELLQQQGKSDQVAREELPDQVDPERDSGCSRSSASIPKTCSPVRRQVPGL